jgi:hypothetical protein
MSERDVVAGQTRKRRHTLIITDLNNTSSFLLFPSLSLRNCQTPVWWVRSWAFYGPYMATILSVAGRCFGASRLHHSTKGGRGTFGFVSGKFWEDWLPPPYPPTVDIEFSMKAPR